jgi:hypothetical protein
MLPDREQIEEQAFSLSSTALAKMYSSSQSYSGEGGQEVL